MTYKQFKGWLMHWQKKAINVRDESHELMLAAFGLVRDHWNTNGLSDLVNTMAAIRGYDVPTVMKYIFFITGGDTGMTEKGLPIVDPEKSWLHWDTKKHVFKVKDGAVWDEMVIGQMLTTWKWFDFAPKTVPNPYNVNSLFSALKKASANKGTVESDHAKMIERLCEVVADCGYAENIEQ